MTRDCILSCAACQTLYFCLIPICINKQQHSSLFTIPTMRRLLHLPRGTIRCDLSVCRHSRSNKKETGEPLGYLPQQIICFGSKKKVAKTEGRCLRVSFHLNTVSLLWASVFDKIWMYLVVFRSLSGNIMLIFCKRSLCRRMVLLGEVFFFFFPFNLSRISQRHCIL